MKAILVIDIDDSLVEGDERFAVDGYLMQESDCVGCYEAVGRIENAVLKPMPNRMAVNVKNIDDIQNYEIFEVANHISARVNVEIDNVFSLGWNACLEEIEK